MCVGCLFCLLCTHSQGLLAELYADGLSPSAKPRLVNNTVSATARARLYGGGGCLFVTSRVLVIDLLTKRLDPSVVSGFLVANAHRVSGALSPAKEASLCTDQRSKWCCPGVSVSTVGSTIA